MKVFKFMAGAAFLFFFTQISAQDRYLKPDEFPEKITSFVETHFPDQRIVSIEEEKDRRKTEYEVKLDDRTELEFDQNFAIKKMDSDAGLPDAVLPDKIVKYVAQNYPGRKIEEWKMKRKYQEVELDNSLELEFDHDGNFLRIDD